MLRALPFQTIGDIARYGLELHVYCPSCYSTRRLVDLERWTDRCFATAHFRCSGKRHDGTPCRAIGMPVVRPAELLPVGGPVTLAFLTCPRCIWEIDQAQLDKPPWSGTAQHYRCPGCGGRVEWHIHGPAWRPGDAPLLRRYEVACRRMKVADAPALIGLRAPPTMARECTREEDSCPKKI